MLFLLFRHQINLEVLKLKENGILSKLENKWWFERSECDVSNKVRMLIVIRKLLIKANEGFGLDEE